MSDIGDFGFLVVFFVILCVGVRHVEQKHGGFSSLRDDLRAAAPYVLPVVGIFAVLAIGSLLVWVPVHFIVKYW